MELPLTCTSLLTDSVFLNIEKKQRVIAFEICILKKIEKHFLQYQR